MSTFDPNKKLKLSKMQPYGDYEIRHINGTLVATIRKNLGEAWHLGSEPVLYEIKEYELPDVSSYEFKSATQAFEWVKRYLLWNYTEYAQAVKRQKNYLLSTGILRSLDVGEDGRGTAKSV